MVWEIVSKNFWKIKSLRAELNEQYTILLPDVHEIRN